jgi:hypothetical protein
MKVDLRSATYDEFVGFVFNHSPEDQASEKWYWKEKVDIVIEPRAAIRFLTMTCKRSGELVRTFTVRQVTEGIDFLFGAGGSLWFRDELWNPAVPWAERRECIMSIPLLYSEVFEHYDDGGLAFMLWDAIAYDYYCGNRDPAKSAEDARVQDAMFAALTGMLNSPDAGTQAAALHGIGHLSHTHGNRAISEFLSSSRIIEPRVRQYAAQVLEGNFQ